MGQILKFLHYLNSLNSYFENTSGFSIFAYKKENLAKLYLSFENLNSFLTINLDALSLTLYEQKKEKVLTIFFTYVK